jgi:hypothetical protein
MAFGTPPHLNALELATSPARATPIRAVAPMCVLINPRSYSVANGRLAARASALAKRHGAEVIEARDPAQITAGLDDALARGARRVFVLAGDGTVQAIADSLARRPAGFPVPQLLLLAGGRTNLTAADFGGRGPVLNRLESALLRATGNPAGDFQVQQRHTLIVEQSPAPPRHGFFMAAALVDALIRHCHREREAGGGQLRSGRFGTAWSLIKAAAPAIQGRAPFACPDLDVDSPGRGRLRGPARLLIATTLVHDRRWLNPYAARGAGMLRMTAVTAGARGFWRSLPRLLTGRSSQAMDVDRGYLSGRCDEFVVRGLADYTLDGQSFRADPSRPLSVRTGPRIDFLMP